ncbi:MAG: thermonuclease family protein [Planctomycetales bacterium]
MRFLPRRAPRRLPRSRGRRLMLLLLVAAFVAYRLFFAPPPEPPPDAEFSYDPARTWRVERVIDGDTLLLEAGHRIRLIGVDTPETKHPDRPVEPLGVEAAEFTRGFVEDKDVRLGFDKERRDRYRRILAYVYVEDRSLNEELIRAGYSVAVTKFPYSAVMKRRFEAAEEEARAAGRGLWALEPAEAR